MVNDTPKWNSLLYNTPSQSTQCASLHIIPTSLSHHWSKSTKLQKSKCNPNGEQMNYPTIFEPPHIKSCWSLWWRERGIYVISPLLYYSKKSQKNIIMFFNSCIFPPSKNGKKESVHTKNKSKGKIKTVGREGVKP